jgi:hypothetical protein
MARHKCGDNGYRGAIVQETAGRGLLEIGIAVLLAQLKARAKVKEVYDRACPDRCDDQKNGLVSYQVSSVRPIRKRIVVGGVRRMVPGVEVRVLWRLLVQCVRLEGGVVDPEPFELPWDDLEDLLAELFRVENLDLLDSKLENVP